MPTWIPTNLTRHHQKRITKDAGCFEDLLGINGRTMTEREYEARSIQAYQNAWAEFEGEGRNIGAGEYYPRSAYFVDGDLVVAITDDHRDEFRTCFHEHFGRKHGGGRSHGEPVGNRQLRYKDHLQKEEQGRMIRNVKRIRGV